MKSEAQPIMEVKHSAGWMVVVCAFNPGLGRQRQADLKEFEGRLLYRVSFRTARATQRNLVSNPPLENKALPNCTFGVLKHVFTFNKTSVGGCSDRLCGLQTEM